MPYVITTVRPPSAPDHSHSGNVIERFAVATLDRIPGGARNTAKTIVLARNAGHPYISQANDLPAEGGTVGPLPDGTVIEVELKVWKWLYDHSNGRLLRPVTECTKASILAAFNEAQAA